MKICVTSQGELLESKVDPRFGRCVWFVIVEPESMDFESIENVQAQSGGGAGVQSAQFIVNKEVEVVLTGNAGPNAFQVLKAAGIAVLTGVTGSVLEVVEKYKRGEYQSTGSPTVQSHFGLKGGH